MVMKKGSAVGKVGMGITIAKEETESWLSGDEPAGGDCTLINWSTSWQEDGQL